MSSDRNNLIILIPLIFIFCNVSIFPQVTLKLNYNANASIADKFLNENKYESPLRLKHLNFSETALVSTSSTSVDPDIKIYI